MSEGAGTASRAASEARATDQTIAALDETAGRISDIVWLISDITGQANLVALKATIEAARPARASPWSPPR